jgi:hypothetical protein
MKRRRVFSALGIVLVAACSLLAQEKPGTVAAIEVQKPKNGMVPQYEAGRKQKAAWHKQQNDPQPLFVWQILTGMQTGDYVVGRLGWHWADFDKPAISDEADVAEFQKLMGNYVDSLNTYYYEYMPKVSNPSDDKMPAKFHESNHFYVRYGKTSDFRSAMDRIHEAAVKTKWPVNYYWYYMAAGGPSGVYLLVVPRNNWADFEDKPDVKPFRDMLKEAFGQAEADSIVDRIDGSVERETTEFLQFRPDLSYMPAK